MNKNFDFLVVGGGIVGLTVANVLTQRYPSSSIAILEKEDSLGYHASGRNSGVLHCGIFYGSDTLKAKVCAEGARRMIDFAKSENINFKQDGKVILATSEEQLPAIQKLMKNAKDNHIKAELINSSQLKKLEPYAAEGSGAIFCQDTAVIDGLSVLSRLKEILKDKGVTFLFGCAFQKVIRKGEINTSLGNISYGFLFNCAGAYADKVAKGFGIGNQFALVPFKGIYWKLAPSAAFKVRANIYPTPDTSLPFLGIHLTKTISGDVYAGPTAIPALGRENYGFLSGANLFEGYEIGKEIVSMYIHNENNFRKLAHVELGKYIKSNFLLATKKLVPSLKIDDFVPTKKAGIRPQLINIHTKKLEMDYILEGLDDSIHVLNAISPAFTASFAFSELIVDAANL
jgi:L-2-hydroxyglutarate oxidase